MTDDKLDLSAAAVLSINVTFGLAICSTHHQLLLIRYYSFYPFVFLGFFFQTASMLGTWYTGIGYDGRKPTIVNMGNNTSAQWDKYWANEQIRNQVYCGGVLCKVSYFFLSMHVYTILNKRRVRESILFAHGWDLLPHCPSLENMSGLTLLQ